MGAIGAQVWASLLLEQFKYNRAVVVPDSYIGVFPPGIPGSLVRDAGFCQSDIFTDDGFKGTCEAGTLTIQDIYLRAMKTYPNVWFTSVDSIKDFVQMAFYDAMAYSYGAPQEAPVYQSHFVSMLEKIENYYMERVQNFKEFDVDSHRHMYTNAHRFYKADDLKDQLLSTWLQQFT